ncbi:MAG: hypothetical protein QM761_00220 [Pseudoxanthomonas sp.]
MAGGQRREAVTAVRAGGEAAAEAGGRVGDGDRVAAGDAADDRAGSIGLRLHAGGEAHAQRHAQCGALDAPGQLSAIPVDGHWLSLRSEMELTMTTDAFPPADQAKQMRGEPVSGAPKNIVNPTIRLCRNRACACAWIALSSIARIGIGKW